MSLHPPPPAEPLQDEFASPRGRDGVPTPVALLLLAVALVVDLAVSVVPAVRAIDGHAMSDNASLALSVVAFLVAAGVVAAVGRTPLRRLAAGGMVIAAIPLHVAFWFSLSHGALSPRDLEQIQLLQAVWSSVTGVLLVGAWGLARRSGGRWAAGVLTVPALVLVQRLLSEPIGELIRTVVEALTEGPGAGVGRAGGRNTAIALAVLIVAGVVCWLIDLMTSTRRPVAK